MTDITDDLSLHTEAVRGRSRPRKKKRTYPRKPKLTVMIAVGVPKPGGPDKPSLADRLRGRGGK